MPLEDLKASFKSKTLGGEPLVFNDPPSIDTLASMGWRWKPNLKYRSRVQCSNCQVLCEIGPQLNESHLQKSPSCPLACIWAFRQQQLAAQTDHYDDENDHRKQQQLSWIDHDTFGDPNNQRGINIRLETFPTENHHSTRTRTRTRTRTLTQSQSHLDPDLIWCNNPNAPSPKLLASNGFYYDPLRFGDDRCTCMYCGVHLMEWELGDDVEIEHARESDQCWVWMYHSFIQDQRQRQDEDNRKEIHSQTIIDADDDPPFFDQPDSLSPSPKRDVQPGSNFVTHFKTKSAGTSNDPIDLDESISPDTDGDALGVEIVETDELDDYLLTETSSPNKDKAPVFPKLKSTDLSEFFTELDVTNTNDIPTSYFNKKRDKRISSPPLQVPEPTITTTTTTTTTAEATAKGSIDDEDQQDIDPHPNQSPTTYDDFNAFDGFDDRENEVQSVVNAEGQDTQQDSNTNINSHDILNNNNRQFNTDDTNDNEEQDKDAELINTQGFTDQGTVNGPSTVLPTPPSNMHTNDEEFDNAAKETSLKQDQNQDKDHNARVKSLENEVEILKKQVIELTRKSIIPLSSQTNPPVEEIDTQNEVQEVADTYDDIYVKKSIKNDSVEKDESDKSANSNTDDRVLEGRKRLREEDEQEENIDNQINNHDVITTKKKVLDRLEIQIPSLHKNEKKLEKKLKKMLKKKKKRLSNVGDTTEDLLHLSLNVENDRELKRRLKKEKKERKAKEKAKKSSKKSIDSQPQLEPQSQQLKEHQHSHIYHLNETENTYLKTPIIQLPSSETEINLLEKDVNNTININTNVGINSSKLVSNAITPSQNVNLIPHNGGGSNGHLKIAVTEDDIEEVSPTLQKSLGRSDTNSKSPQLALADGKLGSLDRLMMLSPISNENFQSSSPAIDFNGIIHTNSITKSIFNNGRGGHGNRNETSNMDNGRDRNQSLEHGDMMKDLIEMGNQSTPHHKSVVNIVSEPHNDNQWKKIDTKDYESLYNDLFEASKYVKEVVDGEYDVLSDDLEGLLTSFVSELGGDQLKMTVREWILYQQEQAEALVRSRSEEMKQLFKRDWQMALDYLQSL